MSQTLKLQLSDEVYAALQDRAKSTGTTPATIAVQSLEREFKPTVAERSATLTGAEEDARNQFESHFGAIASGNPHGADNESIDADLAREYSNNHNGE